LGVEMSNDSTNTPKFSTNYKRVALVF